MGAKAERRVADRKSIDKIEVTDVTTLKNYKLLIRNGTIIDASSSGLLMHVDRKDIVPDDYKATLDLEVLVGTPVAFFLPQMNLDLDGKITRTKHVGKGTFEIGITFSQDVPEYWRECLVDLLPSPGEM